MKVQLENVVLSFANLFEPKGFNGGELKYSAAFLIQKDDYDNLLNIEETINKLKPKEWVDYDLCYKDGDNSKWKGNKNHMILSSSSKTKVAVRDLDHTNLLLKSEDNTPGDKPKKGDTVNAIIDLWVQDNKFGKRINATLIGVQFVKKARPQIEEDPDMPF